MSDQAELSWDQARGPHPLAVAPAARGRRSGLRRGDLSHRKKCPSEGFLYDVPHKTIIVNSATCHTRVACTQTHGSARALKDALLSTKRSASLAFAMSPCADAIRKHVGAVSMEEPSACRSCFFQAFKIRTPGMVALSSPAQWRLLKTSFHQQGTGSARPTRTRPVERPSTRQTWVRCVLIQLRSTKVLNVDLQYPPASAAAYFGNASDIHV